MKSPAVVNYSSEPHSVELREVSRPEPGPEDIILAVEAVGVCGSDLHQWTASHSWKVNYPVVLGTSSVDASPNSDRRCAAGKKATAS
jgi:alcohol dehydrogenase/L-iditol 2-dehydrogenase